MSIKVTSSAPPPDSALPKRYQFIDATSERVSNSTEKRRHVMQEFMRQKRWLANRRLDDLPKSGSSESGTKRPSKKPRQQQQQGIRPIASRASTSSENIRIAPSSDPELDDERVEEIQRGDDFQSPCTQASGPSFAVPSPFDGRSMEFDWEESSSAMVSSGGRTFDSPRESPCSFESRLSEEETDPLLRLSPNPQTVLSAARTDPFDTLPLHLNRNDHALFDFYVNVMPACSYGFHTRSKNAHNWYTEVFVKEAMKAPVCFQNTVLVHAANTQAWVQGRTETQLSIYHRARAIHMLKTHFQKHPADNSDPAISATLSAAAVEDFDPRPERKEISWIHMRAAMHMIRNRGGPSAFQGSRRMAMLINWSDYIFAGYQTRGPSFFFDHDSSISSMGHDAGAIGVQEIREQCDELVTFLRNTEHLALVQKLRFDKTNAPRRYSAFWQGAPLHRLLSSPPGLRYSHPGGRKQIISRLAALLSINAAFWAYRHSTELSERFLKELTIQVLDSELDIHLSIEALIQMLLGGSRDPALQDPDRPWFVGRMLKIAKRLSRASWAKLNDILLGFLALEDNFGPVMFSWEDELKREILEAPLTSYIMPATW